MTTAELLGNRKRAGRRVSLPTNDEYVRLCKQEGKKETMEIMRDYTLALKEAGSVYIR